MLGLITLGCDSKADVAPGATGSSSGTGATTGAQTTGSATTDAAACPNGPQPAIVLTVEDEDGEPITLPGESVAFAFEGGMPEPVVSGAADLDNPLDIWGMPGAYEVLVFVEGYGLSQHELDVPASADGCGPQTVHATVTLEPDDPDTGAGGCSLIWIPSLVVFVEDESGAFVPVPTGSATYRVPGADEMEIEGEGRFLEQPLAVGGPAGLTEISVFVDGYEPQTVAADVTFTEDGCHPETVSRVMTLQPAPDGGR